MRAVLIRHGATAGNEQRRYVGKRTDEPLCELGALQCRRAGAWIDVTKVYSSPLVRARQTASLLFPRAEVVPVAGLEEFDFGVFEGRTADQMKDDPAYRAWVDDNCEGTCPGGESRDDFTRRTKRALAGVLRAAHEAGEEQVVVVAHGGTIMAALDGYYDKGVGNCEGYVVDVRLDGDEVVLREVSRWPGEWR